MCRRVEYYFAARWGAAVEVQPALVVVHGHGSLTGAHDIQLRGPRHVRTTHSLPPEFCLVALIPTPARNPLMENSAESGVHLQASSCCGLSGGRPIIPIVVFAAIAGVECPFAGQLSQISASRPPTRLSKSNTWPINALGFSLLSEISALIASVNAYASVRFIPKPATQFLYISFLLSTSVIDVIPA